MKTIYKWIKAMIKEIKRRRAKEKEDLFEREFSFNPEPEARSKQNIKKEEPKRNDSRSKLNIEKKSNLKGSTKKDPIPIEDENPEYEKYCKKIMDEYGFDNYNEMKKYIDDLLRRNGDNKKRVEKIKKILMTGNKTL